VVGLSLGVAAAFLREYLDNTLKTPEDIGRFLQTPALALIPSVESMNHRGAGLYAAGSKWLNSGNRHPAAPLGARLYRIDGDNQQHSALSEAFRSLRTSVLLSSAERPPRALLVTSAQPEEGKTTISINLAISLAQLGHRTLLIDGDMRRPCIHKAFDIPDRPGLVSYLTGQQDWTAIVQPTGIEGLDALVCGPVPPNPVELLASARMRALIHQAMAAYNCVIIDSPPMLNVADSRILATLVEGILLVVEGGVTPRELVQRAQAHAREVGGNVIGVVLNNLDVRADDYYYSRFYGYHYYSQKPEEDGSGG